MKIDALLKDAGWDLTDGSSVMFEYALEDGTQADYALCDRQGHPNGGAGSETGEYGSDFRTGPGAPLPEQFGVPFVFLSNGEEMWFLDRETDAHARQIAGFYSQDGLERRIAPRGVRRDLSTVETDRRIVDRDYQNECIEALCGKISHGRRDLLVEMATGTGKTRTAASLWGQRGGMAKDAGRRGGADSRFAGFLCGAR